MMKAAEKKPVNMKQVKELVREAIHVEGEHHRLWFIGEIAKELGMKLTRDEQDIMDEGAIAP